MAALNSATESKSVRAFEWDRCNLSHDLLANEFFMHLGPAWHDGRLGRDDHVFLALLGNQSSIDSVNEALTIWHTNCAPLFSRLTKGIAKTYGFVVTDLWLAELSEWTRAADVISHFTIGSRDLPKNQAAASALDFWRACDVVRTALSDMRRRFSDYILRWDGELLAMPEEQK